MSLPTLAMEEHKRKIELLFKNRRTLKLQILLDEKKNNEKGRKDAETKKAKLAKIEEELLETIYEQQFKIVEEQAKALDKMEDKILKDAEKKAQSLINERLSGKSKGKKASDNIVDIEKKLLSEVKEFQENFNKQISDLKDKESSKYQQRSNTLESAARLADKKHGMFGYKRRFKSFKDSKLFKLKPFKTRKSIEANNEALREERGYWEDRIVAYKGKLFVLALRGSRKAEIAHAQKQIKRIDRLIQKNEVQLLKIANNRFTRAKDAIYRVAGVETEKDHLSKSDIKKLEQDLKKSRKAQKTEDIAEQTLALFEAREKAEKNLDDPTDKSMKDFNKINEEILSELKEIKENQIDEQDTSIKKKQRGTLFGKGLGKKASTFKKAAKGTTIDVLAGGAPLLFLDMFLDGVDDEEKTALKVGATAAKAGAKAAGTAAKAASKVTSKAIAPVTKAVNKATTSVAAKRITSKIVKKEAKKLSNVASHGFKRLAGESTEALSKRIASELMAKAAMKSAGKKIPIAGLSVGLGLAYLRYKDGEYGKAIAEIASAVVSIFPGIGTAVSFAIDAIIIWDDVTDIIDDIEKQENKEKMAKAAREAGIKKLAKQKKEEAQVKKLSGTIEQRLAGNEHYQSLKRQQSSAKAVFDKMVKDKVDVNSPEFKAAALKVSSLGGEIDKIRGEVKKSINSIDKYAKERKALVEASNALGNYVTKNGADNSAQYVALQTAMQQRSEALQAAINSDKAIEAQGDKVYLAQATKEYDSVHKTGMGRPIGVTTTGQDAMLLARISKGEGTMTQGYDTTFSYGKYDPSNKPISTMTLGEIKQFQNGMIANGAASSAVGRYQFIRKTLQEVQDQMGLSDDTLFDGSTQDAMILHRLKKTRGYDAWKAGKLSDEKFQLNLSQEFASIANPETGRSYYGQPVGTTTEEIQTVLASIRSGADGTLASTGVTIASAGKTIQTVAAAEANKDSREAIVQSSSQNLVAQTASYEKSPDLKLAQISQKTQGSMQKDVINKAVDDSAKILDGFVDIDELSKEFA